MTTTVSIFAPLDQDIERWRVLAKVYSLLIRLSEELEKSSDKADPASKEDVLEPTATKSAL